MDIETFQLNCSQCKQKYPLHQWLQFLKHLKVKHYTHLTFNGSSKGYIKAIDYRCYENYESNIGQREKCNNSFSTSGGDEILTETENELNFNHTQYKEVNGNASIVRYFFYILFIFLSTYLILGDFFQH